MDTEVKTLAQKALARHAAPLRADLSYGYDEDSPFIRILNLLSDEELLAKCPPMFVPGRRKRSTL
jgi:hypothetical protein